MTLSLSNRGGFLTGPTNSHYPESLKCCLYGALTDQYPPSTAVSLPSAGRRRFHPTWSSMGRKTNSASDNTHHKQTCTTTERRFWSSVSSYFCVCVCVFLLVVMLSVFSMKHSLSVLNKHSSAGQLRSASTALFHLKFVMCSNDIHTRTHTLTYRATSPSSRRLYGAVQRKPFIRHTRRENILAQEENNRGCGNWFWF